MLLIFRERQQTRHKSRKWSESIHNWKSKATARSTSRFDSSVSLIEESFQKPTKKYEEVGVIIQRVKSLLCTQLTQVRFLPLHIVFSPSGMIPECKQEQALGTLPLRPPCPLQRKGIRIGVSRITA